MADVKWTFYADTAAAERAIQRLEQQNAKLENSLSQISKKSKEGSFNATQGLVSHAASVATVITGYVSLGRVIAGIYTENQKLVAQADEIANRYDVAARKWRILSNETQMGSKESQDKIHAVGEKYGYLPDAADAAARELNSAGFAPEQARGPALEALFQSLAANQKFDKDTDAGPLAKASASYLQSQGQALTGDNLLKIGMMADKLGDISTFSIADVEEIAKHGSAMSGKLTQEEQFAAATLLIKEGKTGSESANALEKVTLSLTGKGDKKKTAEALKEMGLEAGDVDMIGETLVPALKKLKGGIESVAPERQDTLLAKLFGVEHFSAAKTLITKSDLVEGYTKGLDDKAPFDEDVATATSGRAASDRRLQARLEQNRGKKAGAYSEQAVDAALDIAGESVGLGTPGKWATKTAYSAARGIGFGQESAIGMATNSVSTALGPEYNKQVIDLLQQSVKSAAEQTDLMKAAAKDRPKLNRNAQGEGAP